MSNGMAVQVVGHEAGKEDNVSWTRLDVANHRGKFVVKFKGAKAENLTRDLMKTLAPGETIASKRLFVELIGEFTTFTKPGSTFKIRYFKAEDYKVVDGPSLALARMRGQAAEILQNSEMLRNAGAVGQAYKMLAAHLAEIAQIPLDLSEIEGLDDALFGRMSDADEGFDPEAAAAAHYARQDTAASELAAVEDAEIPVAPVSEAEPGSDIDIDLDDIPMSADSADDISTLEASAPLEIADETAEGEHDSRYEDDAAEVADVPEDEQEPSEDHDEVGSVHSDDMPEPAPVRRSFGFGRR